MPHKPPYNKHPLAYARVIDKIKLPEQYHKGRKLTTEQKNEMRTLRKETNITYQQLADMFGVSYACAQQTCNKKAYNQMLEAQRRYKAKLRTQGIKPHANQDPMDLRRRKKQLILDGEITL